MKTVLFVCIHNSGRSQMAEAFFNRAARGKHTAISAGTQPAEKVNPIVAKAMNEVGIDISLNTPKALTIEMVQRADRMITMGCGDDASGVCPAKIILTEDWALDDPKDKPIEEVRRIRDEVRARVDKLLAELQHGS